MKLSLSQAKDLIDQELSWCYKHVGSSGKGHDYEQGFIEGLEKALSLINQTFVP